MKTLEEFRYRKVRNVDARRVASFVNNGMNEEELPKSLQKKWEHKKYGREKHLANKYIETVLNVSLKESVNERSAISLNLWIKEFERLAKKNRMKPVDFIKKHISKRKGMDNQVVKDVLKHFQKKESVSEAPFSSPSQLPYSSKEAQIQVDKDLNVMSKYLGKASQQVIKTMMNGVKGGKYDAMDLMRGIKSGNIRATHYGERDFIQQLWNKVREKFRKYSKRGKLR